MNKPIYRLNCGDMRSHSNVESNAWKLSLRQSDNLKLSNKHGIDVHVERNYWWCRFNYIQFMYQTNLSITRVTMIECLSRSAEPEPTLSSNKYAFFDILFFSSCRTNRLSFVIPSHYNFICRLNEFVCENNLVMSNFSTPTLNLLVETKSERFPFSLCCALQGSRSTIAWHRTTNP